jgi:hypothetical protein
MDPKTPANKDVAATPEAAQLSRLSSVLNGLENGASAIGRHVQQAMGAVRAGTYKVDPVRLSKRIVGEAMGCLSDWKRRSSSAAPTKIDACAIRKPGL